jgi:hypothetical protein
MYGGIMFTLRGADVGGVFPYTKHVSFEFSNGVELEDRNNKLEGSGKRRRHLKIETMSDIVMKNLPYYLHQMQ